VAHIYRGPLNAVFVEWVFCFENPVRRPISGHADRSGWVRAMTKKKAVGWSLLFFGVFGMHWGLQFFAWALADSAPGYGYRAFGTKFWKMMSFPLLSVDGALFDRFFWTATVLNSVFWGLVASVLMLVTIPYIVVAGRRSREARLRNPCRNAITPLAVHPQ
jgi:hypothetical protein